MKKNAFLRDLLLLGTLCLTVLPAGAQIESLRNKMGELYDLGYTDSWFS
ncbi:MAG: hypothetical protein NC388_10735 [Clostridium sp.]|nr:hypothetical protein [Clostridium sp.]